MALKKIISDVEFQKLPKLLQEHYHQLPGRRAFILQVEDDDPRILRRSRMTAKEKAEFIDKHGMEAYLNLPY